MSFRIAVDAGGDPVREHGGRLFPGRRQPRAGARRATTDTVASSQSYDAKQGVLGPQWRRPKLRAAMSPRPAE